MRATRAVSRWRLVACRRATRENRFAGRAQPIDASSGPKSVVCGEEKPCPIKTRLFACATDKIRHLSSLRQFERTRNRPENDHPLEFVKRARRRRPRHNREGSHDCSVAPSTQTHHGLLRPQRVRRGNLRRVFFPLSRVARSIARTGGVSVAVKIGQQRESRLVATRAPRCSTRYLFRVASIAAERAVALKPLGVASRRPPATRAPTAPDGRIELARARRIVRRARPTRGNAFISVSNTVPLMMDRRERRGGFFCFFKEFSRSTRSQTAPRRLPRRRTY